jgi:cytochrome b pre-mRNA-processing protein 3
MMLHLFQRTASTKSIAALYGTIVAQARAPVFYRAYGVPDTVNGRFEMIVLHVVLVLRRLESESAPARRCGQALFNRFCGDMDGSLREMGVGDLAVPVKMRKIGEAFYGRQAAYADALTATDPEALVAALARNVFGSESERPAGAARLASYARAASSQLAGFDGETIGRAAFSFPDPETMIVTNQGYPVERSI